MRLFQFGWFGSHSGFQLPWKLSLDGVDWEDVARLVAWKFASGRSMACRVGASHWMMPCSATLTCPQMGRVGSSRSCSLTMS